MLHLENQLSVNCYFLKILPIFATRTRDLALKVHGEEFAIIHRQEQMAAIFYAADVAIKQSWKAERKNATACFTGVVMLLAKNVQYSTMNTCAYDVFCSQVNFHSKLLGFALRAQTKCFVHAGVTMEFDIKWLCSCRCVWKTATFDNFCFIWIQFIYKSCFVKN